MSNDEEKLQRLLGLDEGEFPDQERLDELVHEYKADEAATINNAGREEQISYILEQMEH